MTPTPFINCLTNGEAPVEIKQAAAQGNVVTSMAGFSLLFNNLDSRSNPTTGYVVNYKQDFAGLGGQSQFIRETLDARWYHPITEDFIGMIHLQGGQINSFGSRDALIINNFMEGPSLVRGFAPGGIGPRDISDPYNISASALGGTTYYGASAEVDFPIFGLPKEIGLQGRPVRRRRQPDRIFGSDQLFEFPGLYLLSARRHDSHHPVELRQCVGSEPDPRVGGREPDLGLADGPHPL